MDDDGRDKVIANQRRQPQGAPVSGGRWVVRYGMDRGSGSYWHASIDDALDQWWVRSTASKMGREEAERVRDHRRAAGHPCRIVRLVSRAEAVERAYLRALDDVVSMLQARARAVESLPANGAESHQRGYAQALLDSVEHVDRLAKEPRQ